MKKRGFTLAETLITLGIIGVIAILVLPLIGKVKPDEIKINYLKTYKAISEQIKEMASNSALFPSCQNIEGTDKCFEGSNLFNTTRGVGSKLDAEYENASKICRLLAKQFNAQGEISCSKEFAAFDNANPKFSFTIPDGKQFYVSTRHDTSNAYTEIVFDVNGAANPNCLYNSTQCTNPDRFKIWIDADGTVMAGDAMGVKYLDEQRNWLKSNTAVGADPTHNPYVITFADLGGGEEPNEPDEPDEPDEPVTPGGGGTQHTCSSVTATLYAYNEPTLYTQNGKTITINFKNFKSKNTHPPLYSGCDYSSKELVSAKVFIWYVDKENKYFQFPVHIIGGWDYSVDSVSYTAPDDPIDFYEKYPNYVVWAYNGSYTNAGLNNVKQPLRYDRMDTPSLRVLAPLKSDMSYFNRVKTDSVCTDILIYGAPYGYDPFPYICRY